MYAYIKGEVVAQTADTVVIENNGIGYNILTPNPFRFQLETKYTIYTYYAVREDRIQLYGFLEEDSKLLFLKLIGVTGVGPKVALGALAQGDPMTIVRAIVEGDEATLLRLPGVGKKTARQIILDLRDKLDHWSIEMNTLFDETPLMRDEAKQQIEEVKLALGALGYTPAELKKIDKQLVASDASGIDARLKEALQFLQK
ncbi:MAG: Holliday junction branch migration protein RuvA [Bacilli bacterium]